MNGNGIIKFLRLVRVEITSISINILLMEVNLMTPITWTLNKFKSHNKLSHLMNEFNNESLNSAKQFHSSIPGYDRTPMHTLDALAGKLGVNQIYVKDESKRFYLNAFKALGGAYALAKYLADKVNFDLDDTDFNTLMDAVKNLDPETFATVTAGNHGKGIAWAAKLFGQKSNVYLPEGASQERLKAIRGLGANAEITDMNYDDAVIHIAAVAEKNGWALIQDTAWDGYETIPLDIMKGYATIVAEIVDQLRSDFNQVTHVILQAGVGSFAASAAASIYNQRLDNPPVFIIVEPSKADCLYQSAKDDEGVPQRVHGNLDSMMAGLACGEPNPLAWDILKPLTDAFFSCTDDVSAEGMRILSAPNGNDPKIISGESGALPIGVLNELMASRKLSEAKDALNLNHDSNILIINTEGDTNPENYKRIVNT